MEGEGKKEGGRRKERRKEEREGGRRNLINKSLLLSASGTCTFLEQDNTEGRNGLPRTQASTWAILDTDLLAKVKLRRRTGDKGAGRVYSIEARALESGCVQALPL